VPANRQFAGIFFFMNLERYDFRASETFLDFQFDSEGPNGIIRKVVEYSLENANGIIYFNLGFGDLDPDTGKIDDLAISDNKDRDKILATVAATVVEFLRQFPDLKVYAKGSTKSRTRLYQMVISANITQISTVLEIFGLYEGQWQRFRKNINYDAFLVKRKSRKFTNRKK
jgi:hypothetical protein